MSVYICSYWLKHPETQLCFREMICHFQCVCDVVYHSPEYEEDSEEESGKDWDELEEEAREG